MNNSEVWTSHKTIEDDVERMYEESDKKVFEIMERIAALSIALSIQKEIQPNDK